jgi:hypothetical protein
MSTDVQQDCRDVTRIVGLQVDGPVTAPEDTVENERIHARSITLSSNRLGLIARLNLIEGEGLRVTPVDYKRGKRPHTRGATIRSESLRPWSVSPTQPPRDQSMLIPPGSSLGLSPESKLHVTAASIRPLQVTPREQRP